MLIRIYGPERDGYQEPGENYTTYTVFYYYGNKITRLILFILCESYEINKYSLLSNIQSFLNVLMLNLLARALDIVL
jgi:hypothetical protein